MTLLKGQEVTTEGATPLVDTKKCGECHSHLPLTDFKPNQLMPDGYGKRCKKCITMRRIKMRDDAATERRKQHVTDIQKTLKTKVAGCPLESELLARVTLRMGGIDSVAKLMADDWLGTEPGTSDARRWQEMYFGSCKRNEDRIGSKTDIRNMSTERVRDELNKKIRETIAGSLDANGILKITQAKNSA